MSIDLAWHDSQQTILRLTLSSRWSWAEFFHAKATADALLDGSPHPVAVILDISHVQLMPKDLLPSGEKRLHLRHAMAHPLIVVGAVSDASYFLLQRFFGTNISDMITRATLPEALAYVDSYRDTRNGNSSYVG